MPNTVTFTEQFDNGVWSKYDGCVVTADSHAPPAFAGDSGSDADTVEDTSTSGQASLFGTYVTIANDSSDWVTSVYIRKDAITARYFELLCNFSGGTGIVVGISGNTATGAIANAPDGSPSASGVVDVDASWRRFWFRMANNATGNTVLRAAIYPARSATLGGSPEGSITGSVVAWGINQTNGSALQDYIPDPFYEFPDTSWATIATLGTSADSYKDYSAPGGIAYEYRVLAVNAAGSSPSNTDEATPGVGPEPGAVVLNRMIG